MAFPPVVDHHNPNPNPNHLHLESLPLIDLGLLSQSDLYSLSLTSSSSSQSHPTRRFEDNVLIPKIDRSVFNESAGSRKQTYSRLRLAPRNSQFPVPNPKSQKTIPHSQPRDPETLQIIALLKQLFPSEKALKENDDVLVPVPVRLAQYDAMPGPSAENFSAGLSVDVGTKRKRGRPRKYPNATISYPSVNADVSMEMRGGDNTTPGIVVQSSEGKRKRGRPRKDENRVVSVAKREKKVEVKEAKVKEGNVKVEEAEIVMVNGHGVLVDLAAVENADGLFGEELRRRTEGMDTEAQLLAFLGGLEGQWSSARKKRKIVPADELGDVLPVHWKILLALKRNGGLVRLFCKRYISPNGQQFVSCKEVSSYLISYFGVGNKSIPGHTDGSIQLSNKLVSGDEFQAGEEMDMPKKVDPINTGILQTSLKIHESGQIDREISSDAVAKCELSAGFPCGKVNNDITNCFGTNNREFNSLSCEDQALKNNKLGKDLGFSEQGSAVNFTNDKLVDKPTGPGLSFGETNTLDCFHDGINDGYKASGSKVDMPKVDTGTALNGMQKERRSENFDDNQLTSTEENTKFDDMDDCGNGRSISGISGSCTGPENVCTNFLQQSTSEACSLLPSTIIQSLQKPKAKHTQRERASEMAAFRALRKRIVPSFKSRIFASSFNSRSISTLVLAEHEGGAIKPQSVSAVKAASSLSHENSISLLLAGSGPALHEAAANAASCDPSVSQVLVADSEKFSHPLAEPWARLIHLVQQKGGYSHVITASGSFGKNILPRAAALLDVSPITDVIEISDSHLFVRPIYAGNALCTVRYIGAGPCLLSIRSTSFPVSPISADSKSNEAPISQVDLSTFGEDSVCKSRYVKHTSQDTDRPDLGNARVVVTGGRALKSAENFKMIEKLAEKLGAAVGATRAAVDAGYVPNELQVGQTGKIVAPELYLAFGVSGAIQHLAGMRDSKYIVAVNKDADAPIFQVADYGLVGDIFEVIPELLEKLPEKK